MPADLHRPNWTEIEGAPASSKGQEHKHIIPSGSRCLLKLWMNLKQPSTLNREHLATQPFYICMYIPVYYCIIILSTSSLADHVCNTGHPVDWNKAQILYSCSHTSKWCLLELWMNLKQPSTLNREHLATQPFSNCMYIFHYILHRGKPPACAT